MSNITHHDCIIAVPEAGEAILVSSVPSLMEKEQFDGTFLNDNLTQPDNIPTDVGIFKCVIKCEYTEHIDYYGGGTECDAEIWIENLVKVEML